MSDSAKDVKFSMKVVINKQKTKVLFAEIDSDLADILFSFLTLPLGTIVKILKKQYGDKAPVFGSITTLYDGLSNLESYHFRAEGSKQMLLNPISAFNNECRRLKLDIGDNQPTTCFTCENLNCIYPTSSGLAMYYDFVRCNSCGKQLKKEIPVRIASKAVDGGVFTIRTATFIISDDLQILPNVTTSVRRIISDLGLMGIDGAELRDVTIGFNEIMDLLKHSLLSSTPLTNLVLKKQTKYEPGFSFNQTGKMVNGNSVKVLKVILQKSTYKFLFAEAEEDFVEFLVSFLVITLGGVECELGINSSLKSIDNLYRSIASPIDSKYMNIQEKSRLIIPTIPFAYLSRHWVFSFAEERSPRFSYHKTSSPNEEYFEVNSQGPITFHSLGDKELYIKPRKYMVKDDLTVTPLCMSLYLNTLNERKITLSDVDELELNIGSEECLSILKASLSSTSALSTGLHHLIKKQPKLEQ